MKPAAILFVTLVALVPVKAQNSDLGLLGGAATPQADVVLGNTTVVKGSVGGSLQINYAWQLKKAHIFDTYLELPFVINGRESTIISGQVYTVDGADYFFTPGLRLKFHLQPRIAIYGTAGAGVAWFYSTQTVTSTSVTVTSHRIGTIAGNFGGGLDFRLTRLFSLRVEGRDFLSAARQGAGGGYRHVIVQAGVGFHF